MGKARADYLSAAARATLADAALERKRDLAAEKIAPLREVQEAESEAAEARAALRSAQRRTRCVRRRSRRSSDADEAAIVDIRAAVPGRRHRDRAGGCRRPDARSGDACVPRSAISSTLWLTVHAFERDAVRIEKGVTARLAFPALPGQDVSGHGRARRPAGRARIANGAGPDRRAQLRQRPAARHVGHRRGSGRRVRATPILTVPVAAVQRVRNEWCVFLPKDASTFEIRKIGRGRDLGGEVEVLSGLKAGETIVVDGAFLLKAQAEKGEAGHDEH